MHTLLSIFRITNRVVSRSLADLTDDVARRRTRGDAGPSITWTVGHLLDFRHQLLAFLGDERPNPWTSTFSAHAATDGSDYPSIEAMRGEWQTIHEALEHAFATAAPDILDRSVASIGIHGETRIRDRVEFLAWHEGNHVGVVGAARTAAGLPGPAELAMAAAAEAAAAAS